MKAEIFVSSRLGKRHSIGRMHAKQTGDEINTGRTNQTGRAERVQNVTAFAERLESARATDAQIQRLKPK